MPVRRSESPPGAARCKRAGRGGYVPTQINVRVPLWARASGYGAGWGSRAPRLSFHLIMQIPACPDVPVRTPPHPPRHRPGLQKNRRSSSPWTRSGRRGATAMPSPLRPPPARASPAAPAVCAHCPPHAHIVQRASRCARKAEPAASATGASAAFFSWVAAAMPAVAAPAATTADAVARRNRHSRHSYRSHRRP